jgi:hypothetical protein
MLKKFLIPLSLASLLLFLGGCLPGKKPAALKIDTAPRSSVFIDGKHMGTTPYLNEDLKNGDISIKLAPESDVELAAWESQIKLVSGVQTVINYDFGPTSNSSAGEVLNMESNHQTTASLVIVSDPDAAVIRVDGENKGFTPLAIDDISEGDHQILISSPGYKERSLRVQTKNGYRLTATIQLAEELTSPESLTPTPEDLSPTPEVTPEAETTPEPDTTPTPEADDTTPTPKPTTASTPERPYVQISDTPTGWLRVRAEASTASEELTKVEPGETYPLKDEQSGWYQIEYQDGELGWISGQYAEKFE